MKTASTLTELGLILTTGATLAAPMTASADGLQQNKNLFRNVATGSAILAGIGLATHNNTDTAIGLVGTVVGLSQYEQDRHEQSVIQNCWSDPGNHFAQSVYDAGYDRNGNRFDARTPNHIERDPQAFQGQDRGRFDR